MSRIEKAVERLRRKDVGESSVPTLAESFAENIFPREVAGANPAHDLDFQLLETEGFLTPNATRGRAAEEYRMIKRPLLTNAFGKSAAPAEFANLILVTSALQGEGKTYTTFNLAMSIAMEKDTTVLLVDSDVIKPSLTRLLGLEDNAGLIDVLLEPDLELADVIVSTNVPKLRVLPAGRTHVHSTELLASEQMRRMVSELSQRYPDRVVLFDAPPLLATSEASVLAQLMGQIQLVVEAGKTPLSAVKDAVSQLDESKIIGMILNKSGQAFGSGYYYGGYYGSYGYSGSKP
jgi:exopolysaccharide/PEP-CTERM locus tyrosine autokinase